MQGCRHGHQCVQEHVSHQDPDDDGSDRLGYPAVQGKKKGIAVFQTDDTQYAPEDCVLETDISVKVPPLIRVIPPLVPVQPLKGLSCDPLYSSGLYGAADKKEEKIVQQLLQGDGHESGTGSVYETEGACRKAPVCKALVPDGSHGRLYDPSDKGIDEEQPEDFCKCIFHDVYPLLLSVYVSVCGENATRKASRICSVCVKPLSRRRRRLRNSSLSALRSSSSYQAPHLLPCQPE